MTRPPEACPTCGSRGIDSRHPARCAYFQSLRDQLEARARELGVSKVKAFDLMAHLRTVGDDGGQALERALTVMDLGWRPVVGDP